MATGNFWMIPVAHARGLYFLFVEQHCWKSQRARHPAEMVHQVSFLGPEQGQKGGEWIDHHGEASPDSEPNRHFHGTGFRTHRKCSVTHACGFHCGWQHLSRESHSLSSPKIHVVLSHLPFETNHVVQRYSKQWGCIYLQSSRLKVLIAMIL